MWLYLAVEGCALAAEEAKDPAKDVPKAIHRRDAFLLFTVVVVFLLAWCCLGARRYVVYKRGHPLAVLR